MHLLATCRCLGFRVYLKLSELTLLGLRQWRDFQDFFRMFQTSSGVDFVDAKTSSSQEKNPEQFF